MAVYTFRKHRMRERMNTATADEFSLLNSQTIISLINKLLKCLVLKAVQLTPANHFETNCSCYKIGKTWCWILARQHNSVRARSILRSGCACEGRVRVCIKAPQGYKVFAIDSFAWRTYPSLYVWRALFVHSDVGYGAIFRMTKIVYRGSRSLWYYGYTQDISQHHFDVWEKDA